MIFKQCDYTFDIRMIETMYIIDDIYLKDINDNVAGGISSEHDVIIFMIYVWLKQCDYMFDIRMYETMWLWYAYDLYNLKGIDDNVAGGISCEHNVIYVINYDI